MPALRWLALGLAAASIGCGVDGREPLIGSYVVRGTGERWTLREDGTCTIERAAAVLACEWEYRDRNGERRLVVTTTGQRHQSRYVLAPSKWPGRAVTIPLSSSATLEKQEGEATR